MDVSAAIVLVLVPVLMSMVTRAVPQLNVTKPPPARAAGYVRPKHYAWAALLERTIGNSRLPEDLVDQRPVLNRRQEPEPAATVGTRENIQGERSTRSNSGAGLRVAPRLRSGRRPDHGVRSLGRRALGAAGVGSKRAGASAPDA